MRYAAKVHEQEPSLWTVVGDDGLPYSFWDTKPQAAKAARLMTRGKRPHFRTPGFRGESDLMELWEEAR
jgi:hypothetical protein